MEHDKLHTDGSLCLQGVPTCPVNYKPCCVTFDGRRSACVYDIRYEWWPTNERWMLRIPDGGSSGFVMEYCPHCGKKLEGA